MRVRLTPHTHVSHWFARVIRRGFFLHAAFRYPLVEPRTTGPDHHHLIQQRSWDFL